MAERPVPAREPTVSAPPYIYSRPYTPPPLSPGWYVFLFALGFTWLDVNGTALPVGGVVAIWLALGISRRLKAWKACLPPMAAVLIGFLGTGLFLKVGASSRELSVSVEVASQLPMVGFGTGAKDPSWGHPMPEPLFLDRTFHITHIGRNNKQTALPLRHSVESIDVRLSADVHFAQAYLSMSARCDYLDPTGAARLNASVRSPTGLVRGAYEVPETVRSAKSDGNHECTSALEQGRYQLRTDGTEYRLYRGSDYYRIVPTDPSY